MSATIKYSCLAPNHLAYEGAGGVTGYLSGLPERISSCVGLFDAEEGQSIEEVVDSSVSFFENGRLPFCWLTEFGCEDGVVARLRHHSFERNYELYEFDYDLGRDVDLAEEGLCTIEEVSPKELLPHSDTISSIMGYSPAYAAQRLDNYRFLEAGLTHAYVALHPTKGPVGFSLMIEVPNVPIATLRFAAVVPEERRSGIYRQLIMRRLSDAKKLGMKEAVCYAHASTSGKFLGKFGFEMRGHFLMNASPWGE